MNIYTGKQVQQLDRIAIERFACIGRELMQMAGESAFRFLQENYPKTKKLAVFCGSGNNGGDGYVLATCAVKAGLDVDVVAVAKASTDSAISACEDFLQAGGVLLELTQLSCDYDVLVDALLGTGLRSEPRGNYAKAIEFMNASSASVLAMDVPSGVNADTGSVFNSCVNADLTVTFIANKLGLLTGAACNSVGKLCLDSLNLQPAVYRQIAPVARLIKAEQQRSRQADSHKGNFGLVAIVGGGKGMLGALLLSGKAALRMGAGKVVCLSATEHLDLPALYCPELMSTDDLSLLEQATCIALGPGLGLGDWAKEKWMACLSQSTAMVVDADALTLLAESPCFNERWVLTPHPGEAARLLVCSIEQIQQDRFSAVKKIVAKYGGVCVLKGAGSLVADKEQVFVCNQGNPGMSTSGMGDVLTGMIASLLGQGLSPLNAAKQAVYQHAYLADEIVKQTSQSRLIASDIIEAL